MADHEADEATATTPLSPDVASPLDESADSETGLLLGNGAVRSSRAPSSSSSSSSRTRSTPTPPPPHRNTPPPPPPQPPSSSSSSSSSPPPPATNLEGGGEGSVITLRVKTLDSKEHTLEVEPALMNVSELKSLIARSVQGAEGKFLRLITQGKLLSPDTAPLSTFRMMDRAVVHCVLSDQPPRSHIGIDLDGSGPPAYPEVDDDPATRRGFDRLRTHGFSIQEVAALRSYFNAQVLAFAARQPPREGESVDERRSRMEEEWMARQGEGSEFALNTNRVVATRQVFAIRRGEETRVEPGAGTSRDFVYGFIMGFALGFISLFWLWNIPQTHTQKMGIIAGVSCSLAWNIVRREAWEAEMDAANNQGGDDLPSSFGGAVDDGTGAPAPDVPPPPASVGVGQ